MSDKLHPLGATPRSRMPLSKRIENMFSFLYKAAPSNTCYFDHDFLDEVKAAALKGALLSESAAKERPININYSDILQAGVNAYQGWKENVNTPTSSAYGGNLHDLAHRMYEAMTNAAPQERSAEASSRADGEASAAKKPGATASTPCQSGEAETPCGAAPIERIREAVRLLGATIAGMGESRPGSVRNQYDELKGLVDRLAPLSASSLTETPRTDTQAKKGRMFAGGWYGSEHEYVPADFARQMERELGDLEHTITVLGETVTGLKEERDQLREFASAPATISATAAKEHALLLSVAKRLRDGFTYDPGHSDLDNEQPIHISATLRDWRELNFALSAMDSRGAGT